MSSNIAEFPFVAPSGSPAIQEELGGHILIESLALHGVDRVFGVPGESYLAALDGMYEMRDRIQFVACRQEGGAANMADAYGKLTGRPGICFVTRGPGAANASIGVHTAFQDSTPMILFVGQVASDAQDREGFQEIDYRRMYGQMAKWVAQIERADRIPEYVARAFQTATSGRQGPVVLALPEDMLLQKASVKQLAPYRRNLAWPDPQRLREMTDLLVASKRPLMLVGGSGWTPQGCAALQVFAERWNLPVACAYRFQDTFDNRHPNYVGEVGSTLGPALRQRILDADLIIAVGVRLGEGTTRGYTLLEPPRPRQKLIHAHAGTPAVIALAIAARARPRIPVVQTMHGWGSNKTPEQAARDLAVLQEVDAVVTTSHASARWLQEQGIEARLLTTIPCGLDAAPPAGDPVARFPEVAAAKAAGAAVVVCIGTVSAHKNQARLVEAWPLVRDRIDRALVCVFAGEGPLIPDLERRARQLGVADECRFLGYQPSAALLLALADLLVLPSRGEGQGLAVLEAFRAGVPAVVSDVPALVELVLDGTTGYVARGDTAAALADGIVRALGATAEKRHAITAEAHAQFASHFTTRAMLEAHDALYRQVCRAGL